MKATVVIEKGKDGSYDANMNYYENLSFGLLGQGETIPETIEDFYNSYDEMRALYLERKEKFPQLEFEFKYDMASFLAYYGKVLSLAGLERLTGVNQGQLSHYVTGHRKPSKKTTEKIEKKLHEFGKELNHIKFV